MRLTTVSFLMCLLFSSVCAYADIDLPFIVERKSTKAKFRPDASGVLLKQGDVTVFKKLHAKNSDFKNVYWVNFEGLLKVEEEFTNFGKVLHFEPSHFALVQMTDTNKVFDLSASLHEQGMSCGALISINGDVVLEVPKAGPEPVLPIATRLPLVAEAHALVKAENIEASVATLSAIPTRYYRSPTGLTVADRVLDLYRPYVNGREDVELLKYEHSDGNPQASVIIRIKGTTKPDEIIVLGSHIDSIAYGGTTTRSPGADDNASGTATNLEIFRVLMEKGIRPQRTIEIHGYSAEEIGLVGSRDMASRYKQDDKNVIAMVQHDMNLYCASGPDKIWFVSNSTSAALNSQLISLLTMYQTVAHDTAVLSAGSSDHASWTRNGFHAAFPFENPNNYNEHIHTPDDTIDNSGRFSQAAEFAKLGLSYVTYFAGY